MALDKDSVNLGISILKRINKGASVVKCENRNRLASYVDPDKIFCIGDKSDRGCENVFTNIENISDEQKELWEQLRNEVPNTSFVNKLGDKDITCIGWF
ncbi:hypothetical protein [Parabacteroides distasonis]|uniref:hypothetical protein n=1 Tax=Parabacteroides distasonis TaxID=823 RepID=UPI001F450EE8|nr:hypothetical protein [Parabacteroides distasonis]MCE9060030.1 hypothetical protein [Parabacteroides distasonis]